MLQVLLALVPIGLLLAIGRSLGALRFPGEPFWPLLDRLIYFILLPVLLFKTVLKTDVTVVSAPWMGLTTVVALLTLTSLLVVFRRFAASTGAAFSSVVQGSVRVNVYAGYAIAATVYGDQGVVLFSIVVAFAIPLDNVLSIAAMNMFASAERLPWSTLLSRLFLNPLILSLAAGFACRSIGLEVAGSLMTVLELMSGATLPLALMAVGAGISFAGSRSDSRPLVVAVLARQAVLPIIACSACYMIGLTGLERAAVLLHAALPTGPAAYAVAKQMGGDAPLMANIITATTFCAVVSVPFWLAIIA